MKGRLIWSITKSFFLMLWYGITGDWKYDPVKKRYWPSGRRPNL